MVTIERRDDVPEDTTVTGGVLVTAMVVEACDIMKTTEKKYNSMKHSRHP